MDGNAIKLQSAKVKYMYQNATDIRRHNRHPPTEIKVLVDKTR